MSGYRWIDDAFTGQRCLRCDRPLEDAEVHAVGVARGGQYKNHYGAPTVMVVGQCRACGRRNLALGILPPGPELEAYTRKFISRAWSRAYFDKPSKKPKRSGELQDVSKPPPVEFSSIGIPGLDDSEAKPKVVRPSIRPGTPQSPISDGEQQQFIRRLHRTSLKRKTKSFKTWLRRLTG